MRNTQLETRTAESPSDTVLKEVAAVKNTEPAKLESPLYDAVDPDALDALFAGKDGLSRSGRVSFTYSGCRVVVESDGRVLVRDAAERSAKDSTKAGRTDC